jgi:hypothetical protein
MVNPLLYQVNTRILLTEHRARSLDEIPDPLLDDWARRGTDIVWMLGVWQTGPAGREVSRTVPEWRRAYAQLLPDLTEEDICGSPFAVAAYTTNADFGGDAALARLRARLRQRGLRLLLDLVPNHTALDHPWVRAHPEFYVHGSAADLARRPHDYRLVQTGRGPVALAHGRDPYFPGWPDTLQLNYCHAGLRSAMRDELLRIAERCDGVRCDMAMLLLPDVIAATWGTQARPSDGSAAVAEPFWPEAIAAVRARFPDVLFLAEVYWDREWELLQHGFDYVYDKRLCDRLRAGSAGPVRAHLGASLDFQRRCARFLENHDEPRAAAVFAPPLHRPAAVLTYLTEGMRFFHEGQWQGRRAHASIHLARRPVEAVDGAIQAFYDRLLEVLQRPEARGGSWRLCVCRPAWEGNPTHEGFIAFAREEAGRRLLCAVNYAPTRGQCYVEPGWPDLAGRGVVLRDLLGEARYERRGDDLVSRGLFLDVAEWGHHVFAVEGG